MRKKVLFLVNHDVVIYNFRKELVERLLDDGYEVIISSPYGPRIDDLVNMGCKFEQIDIDRHGKNVFNDFKLIYKYKRLISNLKPDVVLTYTIKPNIYGGIASMISKIPYIANITGLGTAVENPGLLQKITTSLYKISFRNIETIYFQNEENMSFFEERKIYNNKHKLIPGSGVNLEQFKLAEYPPNEKIKFVFISRIMKEKGIDYYLEASEIIKEKYPFTEFHICGFSEEDYSEKLNKMESKGIIKYHGMLKDIRPIIKDMHCTIHPTFYPEGISNVLLESAAMGRPLIATNRSGCREVIDDGHNGYLVLEKNTNDLVEKIEKFISLTHSEKKKMGLLGRNKVEIEFDRQIVVNEYMKNINSIIGE